MPRATCFAPVLILGAFLGTPAPADTPPPGKVFVGYVYGSPRDLDFPLYTHLCHAFLTADADGTLHPPRAMAGRDLVAKAHAAKVSVLISLGGWGWDDQFRAITAKPEVESKYVAEVLRFVDENDYDGIDLDWEYPDTAEEAKGFETLSTHLRAGLDAISAKKGRPMRLTMAASSNPGTLSWLRTEFLVQTYDWVNLMTYDMAGDWTSYAGHNAPLFASKRVPGGGKAPSVSESVDYLLQNRKLPADRIAVGLPLYGRGFAVAEPYAVKAKPKAGEAKLRLPQGDYRNLHKLVADGGWTRIQDNETKVPWLIKDDRTVVFGYDDAESIGGKTAWAMRQGLRGVFFWQVDGDRLPDGSNPLQAAARKAWDGSVVEPAAGR